MTYPLVPYKCGMKVTKARLDVSFTAERVAVAPLAQTVTNSVTFVDSTYLFLTVEANARYIFDCMVIYSGTAAGDLAWQFTFPAAATMRKALWASAVAAATADATIVHSADDVGTGGQAGIIAATQMCMRPAGQLVTGANAGTLKFRFAQVVAAPATTATVEAGSWLRLTKVV